MRDNGNKSGYVNLSFAGLNIEENVMRSTRATAAIERLKRRSGNNQYAMVRTADGLFYLIQNPNPSEKLCVPMEMDDFVKFVDGFGPQTPKRISKLDVAFEKQLTKKAP
jgi:hypothetical protein